MKRLLAAVVGFGLAYRLLYLGTRQLWTDELMQALVVRADSAAGILARLRDGMALPAPLDYFVQKGIVLVAGDSTWALRLHAALFGTLSLWIFYRVADVLFGPRTALYSTALLAVYPLHHHYSQEARPYALFLCLTLVAFDLVLRKLRGADGGRRGWLLLALVLALALFSSLLAVFVVFTQLVGLVVLARGSERRASEAPQAPPEAEQASDGAPPDLPAPPRSLVAAYAVASGAALVLFLPWLHFAWQAPRVAAPQEIANPKLLLRIFKELGDNSFPMSLLLAAGAVTGVRALVRHRRRNTLRWLLVWVSASLLPILAVELWSGYFFAIRHILHVTPALILLAGYGLSYVGERLTILDRLPYRASAPAIGYLLLCAVLSGAIAARHTRAEPVDWLGAARWLDQNLRGGDVVTMPKIDRLLGYYAPRLESARVSDLDPGPGSLGRDGVSRRYVICLTSLQPDPCASFRAAALGDPAWTKQPLRGFVLFRRDQAAAPEPRPAAAAPPSGRKP